jgi:hypothetical protein
VIQQHEDVPFPEDESQTIWRFTDFVGFVGLLETSRLAFKRIDTLGEADAQPAGVNGTTQQLVQAFARAGTQSKPTARGKLERWWAEKAKEKEMERLIEAIRAVRVPDILWIDRWHATDADDALFWRLYGDAGALVALRSSVGALKDALRPTATQQASIGLVHYGNEPTGDGPATAFVRSRVHAFEQELRVAVSESEPEAAGCPATLAVEADCQALVRAVHLSPAADPLFVDLVERLLRRYGLHVPCRLSALGAAPDTRMPMLISSSG